MAKAVGLAAGKVEVMMPLLRDWDFDALITHNRFTLANRNAEEMLDFDPGAPHAQQCTGVGQVLQPGDRRAESTARDPTASDRAPS